MSEHYPEQTFYSDIFDFNTVTRPYLSSKDGKPITEICETLKELKTPQEKAAELLIQIHNNPLNIRQKVFLLLEIDEETFQVYSEQIRETFDAAGAGIDMGLYTEDKSIADIIKTRSSLRGTPKHLVEASIRRRLIKLGNGYPVQWDDDLYDLDPRFKDGDGLKRMSGGSRISYEEAIRMKRGETAYNFVKEIHSAASGRDKVLIDPKMIFKNFVDYMTIVSGKPGCDITIENIARAIEDFQMRFNGNQQIGDFCAQLKTIINIINENKKEDGSIILEDLPNTPVYSYPKFDPKRGRC